MKELVTRAITGGILLALILGIILGTRIALLAMVLVISTIGIIELFQALNKEESKFTIIITALSNVAIQLLAYQNLYSYINVVLVIYMIINFMHFTFSEHLNLEDLYISILAIVYVGMLLSFMLFFPSERQEYLLLVLFSSWGSDTFAYVSGMLFGKTPLSPKISPKKTLEGSIGGTIGAIIISILIRPLLYSEIPVITVGIAVLIGSIVSQLGDLFASRLKRIVGVKDYGNLLLGHGGILDRFDSVLFATPTVWLILSLMGIIKP